MIRKTAKEILADSFRELAEKKAIDKITIKEITDHAGYSPATFYRQFQDKYDLIAWDYSRDLEDILAQAEKEERSWRQVLLDIANYYNTHREYLANLFLHTGGYDSFVRNMAEIHIDGMKRIVLAACRQQELDIKTEMAIRIYCLGTVILSCEWILGGSVTPPETLKEVYEDALPRSLRPYLTEE